MQYTPDKKAISQTGFLNEVLSVQREVDKTSGYILSELARTPGLGKTCKYQALIVLPKGPLLYGTLFMLGM